MLTGTAISTPAAVRRVLNRFTQDELLQLLPRFGYEIAPPHSLSRIKTKIVDYLVNTYFKAGMDYELMGKLDLEYCILKMQTRTWRGYELVKGTDENSVAGEADPDTLVRKLDRTLSMFFAVHLAACRRDNIIWLRLLIVERGSIEDGGISAYMAYVPNSPYFLLSNIKVEFRDMVLQGICTALGCTETREVDMAGKQPASLLDLLVNKHSQGPFTAYRLGAVDSNPLERKRAKREDDPAAAAAKAKSKGPENLVFENAQELAVQARRTTETFGTHEQPKLDHVEYEMETTFRGGLKLEGLFKCKLRIEGPSILEGLKALVEAGAAQMPLPSYLGELHSSGVNSFSLRESAPA